MEGWLSGGRVRRMRLGFEYGQSANTGWWVFMFSNAPVENRGHVQAIKESGVQCPVEWFTTD